MQMPSPLRYDLMLWLAGVSREAAFRDWQIDLARVAWGVSVLDVGCGTGTLAVAAARRAASVHGLDPSSELLTRARKKARRARLDVTFELGAGESLPYPDESFDVVLSSFVLHHLSHDDLRDSVRELRRVVKATGRGIVRHRSQRRSRRRLRPRGHCAETCRRRIARNRERAGRLRIARHRVGALHPGDGRMTTRVEKVVAELTTRPRRLSSRCSPSKSERSGYELLKLVTNSDRTCVDARTQRSLRRSSAARARRARAEPPRAPSDASR